MSGLQPTATCERLRPFGTSIFAEMTALANEHKAINLAQGFPDFDGPHIAKAAAIDAIQSGHSQYARMFGLPVLNEAVSAAFKNSSGLSFDPDREITVTSGCTEALAATILGLLNPGDEIILFEPFYDSYRACVAMSGATARYVALTPRTDGAGFEFDESQLRASFTSRTRAILINTPHNPTGKVFTRAELELIASLCLQYGVIAITDEVYEHLTYESSLPHIHLAGLEGMRDQTITLSSLGKSFSLTGWKIGWAIAAPRLTAAVRAAHQFLTFTTATPLQIGAAAIIANPADEIARVVQLYKSNRDLLSSTLRQLGFRIYPSHGTYFLMADHSGFRKGGDVEFCRFLTSSIKVAAIPPSSFYEHAELGRNLVRFAFCKKRETIEAAIDRLKLLSHS